MIRHIVMWKLAGNTPESKQRNVEQLKRSFHSLQGRIPGLLHLEIGVEAAVLITPAMWCFTASSNRNQLLTPTLATPNTSG